MQSISIDEKINTLKEKLNKTMGTECAVYTRIVGYYRPVKNWNKGKRSEYDKRKPFTVKEKNHE